MKNLSLAVLVFAVFICVACNNERRYEQYRKEHFAWTFDCSVDKVSNFQGKDYSADLPRGRMYVQVYQFESQIPVKIKNEKIYKKTKADKVIDFLESKKLVDMTDLQLFNVNRGKLTAWEWRKAGPVYDSGAHTVIEYSTTTTWIVYLPAAVHRYVVVKVQQDEDVQ